MRSSREKNILVLFSLSLNKLLLYVVYVYNHTADNNVTLKRVQQLWAGRRLLDGEGERRATVARSRACALGPAEAV